MTEAPETEAPVPPLLTPQEWQRQQLAEGLRRQSEARDVTRTRDVPPAEEYDQAKDDLWRRALQEASMHQGAQMLGRDEAGEAMLLPNGALVAVRRRNGEIAGTRPGAYQAGVIAPDEWDAFDRVWQSRKRMGQIRLVGGHYGRAQCIEAGLFTAAEADEAGLPPDPEPGSVAYRLRNSVR